MFALEDLHASSSITCCYINSVLIHRIARWKLNIITDGGRRFQRIDPVQEHVLTIINMPIDGFCLDIIVLFIILFDRGSSI